MADYVIFYNPIAGADGGVAAKEKLSIILKGNNVEYVDVTSIENLSAYINGLDGSAKLVIAGGDGTLNRFVNAVDCDNLKRELYLYPAGNGNDFYTDVLAHFDDLCGDLGINKESLERREVLLPINGFVKNLPSVTVAGKTHKFINGVGYGIDGYCCEVGDALKAQGKKVNYTAIAIKGLLFHFKPRNAKVIVDGVTYLFEKVWIAPTMHGGYYGGGMNPTPAQNRAESGKLSLCVMFGKGKLATLMAFPKIFTGEHVQKENMVKILEGREITVKFEKPCALQIDGETILNVSEYTASVSEAGILLKTA